MRATIINEGGATPVAIGTLVLLNQVVHEVDGRNGPGSGSQGARKAADAGAQLEHAFGLHTAEHGEHLKRQCKAL
jgi:hypothetical protein